MDARQLPPIARDSSILSTWVVHVPPAHYVCGPIEDLGEAGDDGVGIGEDIDVDEAMEPGSLEGT